MSQRKETVSFLKVPSHCSLWSDKSARVRCGPLEDLAILGWDLSGGVAVVESNVGQRMS